VGLGARIGLADRFDRETALRILLFFSAINYDTRGLSGLVNGRFLRGSNFLLHKMVELAERDPEALSPERIADLELTGFLAWFGAPEEAKAPRRSPERVSLLRDTARRLVELYDGEVLKLLEASSGRLGGPGGLRERLSSFKAFEDPLAKKTMVFVILAKIEDLWEPSDPGSMTVGVDYHLQRVALRSGMVKVEDPGLLAKLRARRFVSAEEHHAVRSACLEAYILVGEFSGLSQLEVDQIFWHIGRSCCHYAEQPACGAGKPCYRAMTCSLCKATNYDCPGHCPLDGVCEASTEPDKVKLMEPKFITYYY